MAKVQMIDYENKQKPKQCIARDTRLSALEQVE